ncbi:MAG TPA: lactonase family protein [Devosiaceae bacterium]|nr:lactonase family protein [Devosiaceae bacterium]
MTRALMFVGSCTGPLGYVSRPAGKGVAAFRIDLETGLGEELAGLTGIVNPTFLAVAPGGRSLLATSELEGQLEGLVTACAIDRTTGALRPLGREGSRGWTPAHLGFSPDARYAGVANYGAVPAGAPPGASVAIFALASGGAIARLAAEATHAGTGPNAARQDRPHGHCVRWTPDGRFVLVCDLGIDRLVVYRFEPASGAIARHGEIALPAGDGPRHLAFHPDGRRLYVVCELSSSVASFAWDSGAGAARLLADVSTLPAGGFAGNSCSAIAISPDGRRLYAGNRGHDSLARFAIDAEGVARFIGTTPSGGRVPRDFAFDPSGRIIAVANQESDCVTLFRYEPVSGDLIPLGQPIPTGSPTAIAFHPLLD